MILYFELTKEAALLISDGNLLIGLVGVWAPIDEQGVLVLSYNHKAYAHYKYPLSIEKNWLFLE